jgi:UDP-N-acetyl-D-glucosamine dehydrogenase
MDMNKTEDMRVLAIIGQGYVGLPLAMAAVDAGWNVVGIDKAESKVMQINAGSSPVEDVSDAQLSSALSSGAYRASDDFAMISEASVVTICVPTPLGNNREPDLSLLMDAASAIAPHLATETLVVSESTSYPGTLRDLMIPIIEAHKSEKCSKLYFASAPERVNPGDLKWSQHNTPRLIGAVDEESLKRADSFYRTICTAVVKVGSPEIAEAAKLLENTFRLVNIALVNEFARLCHAGNLNVYEVIEAASTKPYGFMGFQPGVGVGGHCIPVDPLYLTWWARKSGEVSALVECADSVNISMPEYVASRALKMIQKDIIQAKVLILGVAYKSGISDIRETPADLLRESLESKGAQVAWRDPLVKMWHGTKPVTSDWECDVAIIATNQPGTEIDFLLNRGVPILDCTSKFRDLSGVTLL